MSEPAAVAASPALTPPPGNPRFPLMDAARGVAAVLVVLAHCVGHAPALIQDLFEQVSATVQLFFGLSGFLLMRPFIAGEAGVARRPRISNFLRRRTLRIIPAYWFALLAVALLLGPHYAPGALGPDAWRYFGFVQVYSLAHDFDGLGVAWSVCVEVSFYLLLPLLVLAARALSRGWGWRRGHLAVIAPLLLVGPVVRLLNTLPLDPGTVHLVQRVTYALPGQINFFAVGMLLALASVDHAVIGRLRRPLAAFAARPLLCWGLGSAVFLTAAVLTAFSHVYGGLDFRTRFLGNDVLSTAFVALMMIPLVFDHRPGPVRRAMRLRPVLYAGLVSYGLTLWHVPVLMWLTSRGPLDRVEDQFPVMARVPLVFGAVIAITTVIAALSYRYVELPFLRLKPGYSTPPARPPAEPVSSPAAP